MIHQRSFLLAYCITPCLEGMVTNVLARLRLSEVEQISHGETQEFLSLALITLQLTNQLICPMSIYPAVFIDDDGSPGLWWWHNLDDRAGPSNWKTNRGQAVGSE